MGLGCGTTTNFFAHHQCTDGAGDNYNSSPYRLGLKKPRHWQVTFNYNSTLALPIGGHGFEGGHGGRVVTLSPPTSEPGVRSPHGLKWESW